MGYIQLFVVILAVSSIKADEKPGLCSLCECVHGTEKNASLLQVKCSSDVKSTIFNNTNNELNSVQRLVIRNNEFVNLKDIFVFDNLVTLDLSANNIENISEGVFAKLQKLETLILSSNAIENLEPEVFKGVYVKAEFYPLEAFRSLTLDHNKIRSLNPDVFEHIEKLEQLSLAYNPLKSIDDHTAIAITNLYNLKYLDLSYTQISALPQYFLHAPKHISILNLSGNAFAEIPKQLVEAVSLETFVFNDNALVNLTEENGFPPIPSLRVLHLCLMPELESIGPGALANLTNLSELYIALNPKLSFIDENILAKRANVNGTYITWPGIKKLYLNDNQLSYMNMSLVARWDALAELDLSDNPWTCECENQWMVETLMPIYLRIDEEKAKEMKCAAPIEMNAYTFEELHNKSYNMRCLDLYGARPEEDAPLLVALFAGVLIAVPIVLFGIYSYKRHWFGIFDDSPAAFSRQFYGRTSEVYEY